MRSRDVVVDVEPEESTLAQDGITPAEGGALPPVERELGYILDEENDEQVAKHVIDLRRQQNGARTRRRATWLRNRYWREGKRWVRLEKKENQDQWKVWQPPGMANAPPVPNKTDRLCRRVVNTVLVDRPYPECEPAGNTAEAKESAEFATRYLLVRGSESELNLNLHTRRATNTAMHMASGFLWVTMDPHGNGHRPRTLLAHPLAQSADDALIDPTTGEEAPEEVLTERFQRPDGALTDNPSDADLQWLPNHKIRLLTGLQLDFLPATATGIADAEGVVIVDTTSLGDLRSQFPDVLEGLSEDQLTKLCSYRPDHVEDILPPYTKAPEDQKYKEGPKAGQFMPSQMVVVTTVYYRSCASYPLGCYAVVGGDALVLHKQTWTASMPQPPREDGSDAPDTDECLMIPVAQFRALNDDLTGDPYGTALAESLGPMDEIRAGAFAFESEHLFRASHPIPFLPTGSIVQPGQLRERNDEPVYFNPQGKPEWEQVPPLPPTVLELRNEMTNEMNDESGLQEAAQGVENPQVKSGIHAQTIVQQALKALMEIKDNVGEGYIRTCQVILQQARAYLEVPQLVSFVGQDGEYKAREFTRVDFGNTRVVSIQKGTFTMHTPAAKQQMAAELRQAQAIDNETYMDLVTSGTSPVLGQQEHPALLRVRRQLTAFKDGPTPEWTAAMAEYTQQMAQYQAVQQQMQVRAQMLAAQGVQSAPPQIPPPQKPPGPFDPRLPIDDEPMAAKIRHRQVFEAMASTSFLGHPPEWQQLLTDTYLADRNAAGIMTVPDVQRQKAQEAAMQPPALPKGVTIGVKATEDTVDDAERNAMAGFQRPQSPQPT